MECCHNNGIRNDNRLENLRWDTREGNIKDKVIHGTNVFTKTQGEKHHNSKLKEQEVRTIIYVYRTGDFSIRDISKMYDVSYQAIYDIVTKRRWKYIWKG